MITDKQVLDALPPNGFLRSYVRWAGRWLEAGIGFHLSAGLTLLAQTVPAEVKFPGITEVHANLYALLVGPSSVSQKTRSIQAAESVLQGALPECIMTRPGSPEACVEAINDGNPQILFYEEFGSFLQGTEKGRGQLAPLRMVLTDLYDCGRIGKQLVSSGRSKTPQVYKEKPRLSILAGVTPGLLEAFTTEIDWTEGFLGRFFTIYATSERANNSAGLFHGEDARQELVKCLKGYATADDIFTPKIRACEGFGLGAITLWDEWCYLMKERALKGERESAAAVHRALGHAIKVALLLSWDYGQARSGEPWSVELDALEPAIKIVNLHIESVEEIAQGLAVDRDMKDERRMLLAISEDPVDYAEALRRAHLIKKRADDMIASLLEKNLIARVGDSDILAPIRYVRVKRTNVIPFPGVKEA
jgi:hypothetical protein